MRTIWARCKGTLLLVAVSESLEERERIGLLVKQLTTSYEGLGQRLCRMFGRPFDRGEEKRA